MKKIAKPLFIAAILAALALAPITSVSAAESSLKLSSSIPENGDKGMPVENAGIKLYFNEDVTDDKVWDANKAQFKLVDSEGKSVASAAYKGKEEGYVLVLAEPAGEGSNGRPGSLKSKAEYTLEIGSDLQSTEGNTLGEKASIGFLTTDVDFNMKLNVIMMVAMMVGMFGLMIFNNVRKAKAEAEVEAVLRANPYKIAKDKGISVDEAKTLIEKKRAKTQKSIEAGGGKMPTLEELREKNKPPRIEKPKKKTYKVSGPKPVSAAGSKYRTGRKANAKAANKANNQSGGGQKKGSKGQQKKKKK
ncbi:MAG: Ig-like domain-containing protein [Clostridiales Family XIII bacterium]|jgi:hypothetical protein|nr:Ig-like domain-containing protein [Clostridiales Family XIII bacterium]